MSQPSDLPPLDSLGTDRLSPEEAELAQALRGGPLPEPRRGDAAFARRVLEQRRARPRWRWLALPALTSAGALAAFVLLPGRPVEGPTPVSGRDLLALSSRALDDELGVGLDDDALEAAAALPSLVELGADVTASHDDPPGTASDVLDEDLPDDGLDDDEGALLADSDSLFSGADELDELDLDDLRALDDLLTRQLAL